MTLVLALCNSEQVIQIADRRLTSNGHLVDDESSKAVFLTCANGRMCYGFSGLAMCGEFITRDWLIKALLDCGPPKSYDALSILEMLTDRASHDFKHHPALKAVRKRDKRLSILFSGYLSHCNPSVMVNNRVNNRGQTPFSFFCETRDKAIKRGLSPIVPEITGAEERNRYEDRENS